MHQHQFVRRVHHKAEHVGHAHRAADELHHVPLLLLQIALEIGAHDNLVLVMITRSAGAIRRLNFACGSQPKRVAVAKTRTKYVRAFIFLLMSRLTDAAPVTFRLEQGRHRGARCRRLVGPRILI